LAFNLQIPNQKQKKIKKMTNSIKQQFEVYSNALSLRNKRNEILASNIANAATPNFKARDINF